MVGNFDKTLEKIARLSGIEKTEVERKIEAKRAKLSGLISREGAAQIVAAELGISFTDEVLKIDELLPGMKKVNTCGKIIRLSPVRTFQTKKGDEGKVANLFIADDTSNLKVVLWDTNHIALIESGKLNEGTVVEIGNGSMRDNELHLGSFSELKISDRTFDNVQTQTVFREMNISDLSNSDNAKIRGFIVQSFDPRFFHVCPECKKKAVLEGDSFNCMTHGKVNAEKRALVNFVIDDGTETIRAVAFHENLKNLGLTDFENPEGLLIQKEDMIGKEKIFSGQVRVNRLFNTPEFILNGIQDVNLDSLIGELEKH